MNLWVVDNITPINRINSEWNLIFPVLKRIIKEKKIFKRIELISSTTNIPNSDYHWYLIHQSSILNEIIKNISYIQDRDVILFTDARFYNLPMIFEYFRLSKIKPFIIGIWNDGLFNPGGHISSYYKKNKIKQPVKWPEKSISDFIDLNIHPYKSSGWTTNKKHIYCPLPMDLLEPAYELIQLNVDINNKTEDIIYSVKNNLQDYSRKFEILINEMSDYSFWDINQIKNSNILSTYNLLNRGKYYINFDTSNILPIDLYHLTILGVIPITPYTGIIKQLTENREYFLDSNKLVNESYIFIRYIKEIIDLINLLEEDYISNLEYFKETLKQCFDFNKFLNMLYHVANRK